MSRITAAISDLEHIANAEERVVIDTAYVVRLFVLDDVQAAEDPAVGFELPRPVASADRIDGFVDEEDSVYWGHFWRSVDSPAQKLVAQEANS